MAIFVPRAYQHLIRNYGLTHDRCNIFSSPGTGKTGACIDIFDSRRAVGDCRRALVLAPKRVALSTWPYEVPKWDETFGHLRVAAAIGTVDQRLAALRQNADITTINYEGLEWLLDVYGEHNWPFDFVIADESTRLKGLRVSFQRRQHKDGSWGEEFLAGQGAARARALARVAHLSRFWINATGSPAPNGLKDLWGQQWFVDRGSRLGASFDAFKKRWFRLAWGSSREAEQIEPLPYAEAEIQALMRQCSITVDAKDWFPLEKVIEREVFVDLPPQARALYKRMEKEMFLELQTEDKVWEVEVFNPGGKIQKCLQLGNGALYVDGKTKEWERIHDEKLEALRSLVEETNGEPLLISYQNRPDKERILKAFPRFKFLDTNPQTVKDFQDGKIPGLLAHPKSAGHGLDLQHNCRVLIDYSSNFNLEEDEQIIERIGPTRQHQIGNKRSVFRYRIVARGTIEQHVVLPALQRKTSVQDAFKNAMKQQ